MENIFILDESTVLNSIHISPASNTGTLIYPNILVTNPKGLKIGRLEGVLKAQVTKCCGSNLGRAAWE